MRLSEFDKRPLEQVFIIRRRLGKMPIKRLPVASGISEPSHSFRGAAVKTVWARELLNNLNTEIIQFIDRKPYTISLEPYHAGGGYLLNVNLTEDLPWYIPCLMGDICHNLRASMDFAWMGAVRSVHPDAEKRTLPICSNRKGIETTVKKTFEDQTNYIQVNRLLSETIACHHDFENGGNLWISDLNELSNWQKHNMLIPVFTVTRLGENTIIKSNDGSMIDLSLAQVGGRVAGIGGTYAEMTYDSPPTVEVGIDLQYLGQRRALIPTLAQFAKTAEDALKAFCDAFPSPHNPVYG